MPLVLPFDALEAETAAWSIDRDRLDAVREWVVTYLCEPHPQLGRGGPVCPYVRPSIARNAFWIVVLDADDVSTNHAYCTIRELAYTFLELEPKEASEARYKTLVALFPRVGNPQQLDVLQKRLKPIFVRIGLMVGQFHEECDDPGLWNSGFRPLRSPVPLLAIRQMVSSDLPFLVGDPSWLAAYFVRFAPELPSSIRRFLVDAITDAHAG